MAGMGQSVVMICINNTGTNCVAERKSKELSIKGFLVIIAGLSSLESQVYKFRSLLLLWKCP